VRLLQAIRDDACRHNRARSPRDRRDLRAHIAERIRGVGDVTGGNPAFAEQLRQRAAFLLSFPRS
jgi:hypothetical protein